MQIAVHERKLRGPTVRGQESDVPGAKQAAGDAGLNRCRTNPQESLRKNELWGSTVNRGQDVSCGRDDGKESSGRQREQ